MDENLGSGVEVEELRALEITSAVAKGQHTLRPTAMQAVRRGQVLGVLLKVEPTTSHDRLDVEYE